MKSSVVAAAITGLFLAGCAAPGPPAVPYTITTPYSEAETASWDGPGPASLDGEAFLKTQGGEVRTCAGESVYLLPGNAYTEDMLKRTNNLGYTNVDSRYKTHQRQGICDAQGHFHFDGLPARKWVVDVLVQWWVPDVYSGGQNRQGGELAQSVDLHPGKNTAYLTDRDLLAH